MKSFKDTQDLILVYMEPNCLGLDKESYLSKSVPTSYSL